MGESGAEFALTDAQIETCARAAHEVNRAWCLAHGDASQLPWDAAPDWAKLSALEGVRGVLWGNTPRESHAAWLAHKAAAGWTWGPVKDPERKQHPCMVPYDDLPPEQRAKDAIFVGVVRTLIGAFAEVSGCATP